MIKQKYFLGFLIITSFKLSTEANELMCYALKTRRVFDNTATRKHVLKKGNTGAVCTDCPILLLQCKHKSFRNRYSFNYRVEWIFSNLCSKCFLISEYNQEKYIRYFTTQEEILRFSLIYVYCTIFSLSLRTRFNLVNRRLFLPYNIVSEFSSLCS